MVSYDVSVSMGMTDNVSGTLKKINTQIEKVLNNATEFESTVQKLTKRFNTMNDSLAPMAYNLERIAASYKTLNRYSGLTLPRVSSTANLNSSVGARVVETPEERAMREILASQERVQKSIRERIKLQEDAARRSVEAERKAAKEREAIVKRLTKQGEENQKRIQREAEEARRRAMAMNNELARTRTVTNTAKNGIDSLTSSIKRLAMGYISLQSAMKFLNTSDSLILTEGKLSNMTDDVEGLMDNIYQMSQDTRTSYLDNASQIAKMWQLTGGTEGIFETQDKLLQFNEVLNKGFILGGSGTREINASLYQLTQALSSGRLQGDELRSLAENAPYLINSITTSLEEMYNEGKDQSQWIDLTYKDLKELGAQGVLTSDLIVSAVLNSTDEIRDAYKNLTPTFAQVFQTIKNQATKIAEPILKKINEVVNSEAFAKTAQAFMKMLAVVVAALNPVIELILWVGEIVADNWAMVEPVIWGIVSALAVYGTYLLAIKAATVAVALATSALKAVQLMFKGLTIMAVLYQLALGKVTWAQTKMALASIVASGADATKTKTNWSVVTSEWAKVKAMATSTKTLWGKTGATAVATGATAGLTGATWGFVTAEYAALAPILAVIGAIVAVIAIIVIAVKAWNYFGDTATTVMGAVAGGVAWLAGWIWNAVLWVWNGFITVIEWILAAVVGVGAVIYDIGAGVVNFIIDAVAVVAGTVSALGAFIANIGAGIWNGAVNVVEGIVNLFIWAKNMVHNAFSELIEFVNGVCSFATDIYNSVTGKQAKAFALDVSEKVDVNSGSVSYEDKKIKTNIDIGDAFMEGFNSIIQHRVEYANPLDAGKDVLDALTNSNLENLKADYINPDAWASEAIKWGDGLTAGLEDYDDYMKEAEKQQADAEKLMKDAEDALNKANAGDNDKNSLPNYSGSNLSGGGLDPETEAALGAIKGDTGAIADNVSVSSAELELLRELAERKAINRFTTAEVKITNHMNNNINSEMDMDGEVNYLTEELNKALVAGSEAANHY